MEKFILSTEKRNSRNLKVLTSGIDLSLFNENPVMTLNHNLDKILGKWVNIAKEEDEQLGYILTAVPEFDEDKDSQEIQNKVIKGTIKGASIAGEILEGYMSEEEDVEVLIVVKMLLKEVALTALPANTEATKIATNAVKVTLTDNCDIRLSYDGVSDLNDIITKLKSDDKKSLETSVETSIETSVELPVEINLCDKLSEITGLALSDNTAIIGIFVELSDKYNKVNKELAELKLSLITKEIDSILDKEILKGVITEDKKSELIQLSEGSISKLNSLLSLMVINKKPEIHLTDKISNITDNNIDKDFDWYRKNASKELKLMAETSPIKYNELLSAYINKKK